jgi:neopullulanase
LCFFTGRHLDQQETNRAGGYRNKVRPLNVTEFADRIDYFLGLYDSAITQAQLNLLDSHDTPRFLTSASGDVASLKLAMLFMFTYPGAPCLYYGDEIGMDGCHDPECRKSFPWDKSRWNGDILSYTKQCISLRQTYPALRRGSFHRLYANDGVYIFGRKMNDETLVIALNAAEQEKSLDIGLEAFGLPNGPLAAIFGEARAKVQGGKIVGLKLTPRSAVVLKGKEK